MEIRETSFSLPRFRGNGLQTATQAVVFPRPVIRAVAGVTGYSIGFAGDDHHVGLLELGLDTAVNANVVEVRARLGVRDWSGFWDDDYAGTITAAVLADLEDITAPPARGDLIVAGVETTQAIQSFRSAEHLDSANVLPDNAIPLVGGKATGLRFWVDYDADAPDVYKEHLDSKPAVRRRAMAETYRLNWSREPVRKVMASVPTYMMWDDHDIRDGWGSEASDSPTLATRFPRGQEIFLRNNAYFEDAGDVYWHFQGCHNPMLTGDPSLPNYVDRPPAPGTRRAMPFVFRCGRLVVLVVDARGDRDVFRKDYPILGAEQWNFIDSVFAKLPEDVEALAVMTPTPIASMDPDGQVQNLLGDRTDDVVAFSKGRSPPKSSEEKGEIPVAIANVHLSRLLGTQLNLGRYMISKIDEARDQWSHKFARPEQADLLRKAGAARMVNVIPGAARGLIFLSGDIHVGCIFDISCSRPDFEAASLTASGISAKEDQAVIVGTFLDESFRVAPGVRSTLREVTRDFNFGVVQVVPTGTGAEIIPTLAHEGSAAVVGLDLAALVR